MHDNILGTWVAIRKIKFDDFTVMGGSKFDVVKELQYGEVIIRKEDMESKTLLSILKLRAYKKAADSSQ
jgi:hypothetical protein